MRFFPGGGAEHLMSLGTNQKKQQGVDSNPHPHPGSIKNSVLDICMSELPFTLIFFLCAMLDMYNSNVETHLATLCIVKGV